MYCKKRADRRSRTLRYATRAWKVWAAPYLRDPRRWGSEMVDGVRVPKPPLETAFCVGRYRKGKAVGCNCRKRKRGQPKRGGGICYSPNLRPSVMKRIQNKRLCRAWKEAVRWNDPLDINL